MVHQRSCFLKFHHMMVKVWPPGEQPKSILYNVSAYEVNLKSCPYKSRIQKDADKTWPSRSKTPFMKAFWQIAVKHITVCLQNQFPHYAVKLNAISYSFFTFEFGRPNS
ncbi:unnamed protein product [Ilex paraguariensis]|uniref:Uncharacterized protein n=1 Tax=Ilex paraguariensis TaxID=185542 RepID=A0ABC8SNS4_9AQUA